LGEYDSRVYAPLRSIFQIRMSGHCAVGSVSSSTGQWKMDIRGANDLESFTPMETPLFAMELPDDLITVEAEQLHT
jgi:hypothetical protein